jgi:hypothetical protein
MLPNRVVGGVKIVAMAWFTLIFGGLLLIAGIVGQIYGTRRGNPAHPEDKRIGKIVLTIGSAVVGLWLMAFSVAHLLQLYSIGHW